MVCEQLSLVSFVASTPVTTGIAFEGVVLKPVPLVAALKVIETLGEWCCLSCLIK